MGTKPERKSKIVVACRKVLCNSDPMKNETSNNGANMKCRICGKKLDLENGNGCSDEHGNWAHEECAMADEENAANEADFRD